MIDKHWVRTPWESLSLPWTARKYPAAQHSAARPHHATVRRVHRGPAVCGVTCLWCRAALSATYTHTCASMPAPLPHLARHAGRNHGGPDTGHVVVRVGVVNADGLSAARVRHLQPTEGGDTGRTQGRGGGGAGHAACPCHALVAAQRGRARAKNGRHHVMGRSPRRIEPTPSVFPCKT
jgi:hypothetical protein